MTPLFSCIPVCTFFTALGLLFALVMVLGIYNRDALPPAPTEPSELPDAPRERSWWLIIAVIITIIVPTSVLLVIWLAPEW